jgi:hypothetical protein
MYESREKYRALYFEVTVASTAFGYWNWGILLISSINWGEEMPRVVYGVEKNVQ